MLYSTLCSNCEPTIRFIKKGFHLVDHKTRASLQCIERRNCINALSPQFLCTIWNQHRCIGVVFSQSNHPVGYHSQRLLPYIQNSSTYSWEMFAITSVVWRWGSYLLGRRFIITTDHQSVKQLTAQTIQTPKQQRWLAKLLGFDFEIKYKPGS